MIRSTVDLSIFYHHISTRQCIYLIVSVDDIAITGSDQDGRYLETQTTPLQPLSDKRLGETQVFSRH